jgi:hypothetical protein
MTRFIAVPVCVGCLLLTSCIPLSPVESPPHLISLTLTASVTEIDPITKLPRTLSGTMGGAHTGTYTEQILELFFDPNGNLVGASSLSHFAFDPPCQGTISSYNFAESVAPIFLLDPNQQPVLDPNGIPIVIGLKTAATGSLFDGTGSLDAVFGDLQTDSELSFTGGDLGLGQVRSSIWMLMTETEPALAR